MSTEQERMNAKKRAIALKLVDHPEHYLNSSGNLNDSRLCYYQDGNTSELRERVFICAKYSRKPGIGIYFAQRMGIKKEHLPSLHELKLPDGFVLHEKSISDKDCGWVVFGKNDCKKYDDMYAQIVDPGNSLDAWKSLYDVLTNWLGRTFVKLTFYSKEMFSTERC